MYQAAVYVCLLSAQPGILRQKTGIWWVWQREDVEDLALSSVSQLSIRSDLWWSEAT